MSVWGSLMEKLKEEKLHFALLDPDKQSLQEAGEKARIAELLGSSAVMLGGSTLKSRKEVDDAVKAVKKSTNLPVILFPSKAVLLSRYADAVFVMSLMNSRNVNYIIREQGKGMHFIKDNDIEAISMGYVIVEPGMTVGKVGEADLIKEDDIEVALGYALYTDLGGKCFYLEAGSGADRSVPNKMISVIKKNISIPLIVGGGIRTASIAREKAEAGADIIVTGTIIEDDIMQLEEIISALKSF